MIILGIDPGIERLGWGLLEKNMKSVVRIDSGVHRTLKSSPQAERLFSIYNFVDSIIQTRKPAVLAVERLFFANNAKTASVVGEVRGVILTLAAQHRLVIREFTPLQVKMNICGNGKADKKEVAAMLRFSMEIPQTKMLDDETDALAIALCGALQKDFV